MRIRFIAFFSIFFFATFAFGTVLSENVFDIKSVENESLLCKVRGDANFYWEQHLSLDEIAHSEPNALISLPGIWNNLTVDSSILGGSGYATIAFKVTAPDSLKSRLAISIPTIFSSYRLYLDTNEIANCGDPQERASTTIARYYSQVIEFSLPRDTAYLIFHISNFTNDKGGPWQPIYIGEKESIHQMDEQHFAYDVFLVGALFAFALAYFITFLHMKNSQTGELALNFSIFTGAVLVKLLVTSNLFLYHLFPTAPTTVYVHIEYLTFFVAPLFYHNYLHKLFQPYSSEKVLNCLRYFVIVLTGFSLLTPLLIYSHTVPIFQVVALLLMAYHFYLGVRMYQDDHYKSVVLLVTTFLLVVATVHDILQVNSKGSIYPMIPLATLIGTMFQATLISRSTRSTIEEYHHFSGMLEKVNGTLSRFVPRKFFTILNCTPSTIKLGSQINKKMSVLFIDIRNFSEIQHQLSSEEEFQLISKFFEQITPIITTYGGIIDKFIADSAMVIFPDKPNDAIFASLGILSSFEEKPLFHTDGWRVYPGIGVHYGKMILGVIGNEDRIENTVIGDAVNTAARMRSLTHQFCADLIVSREVLQSGLVGSETFHIRSLGTLAVKGKRERTTIQEIFFVNDTNTSLKLQSRNCFEQGIVFYEAGRFYEAERLFREALTIFPEDKATLSFIERCQKNGNSIPKREE